MGKLKQQSAHPSTDGNQNCRGHFQIWWWSHHSGCYVGVKYNIYVRFYSICLSSFFSFFILAVLAIAYSLNTQTDFDGWLLKIHGARKCLLHNNIWNLVISNDMDIIYCNVYVVKRNLRWWYSPSWVRKSTLNRELFERFQPILIGKRAMLRIIKQWCQIWCSDRNQDGSLPVSILKNYFIIWTVELIFNTYYQNMLWNLTLSQKLRWWRPLCCISKNAVTFEPSERFSPVLMGKIGPITYCGTVLLI